MDNTSDSMSAEQLLKENKSIEYRADVKDSSCVWLEEKTSLGEGP